jgi:hypothetical protein
MAGGAPRALPERVAREPSPGSVASAGAAGAVDGGPGDADFATLSPGLPPLTRLERRALRRSERLARRGYQGDGPTWMAQARNVVDRTPRWMRGLIVLWVVLTLVSTWNEGRHRTAASAADSRKLTALLSQYHGQDPTELAAQIRHALGSASASAGGDPSLLSVPFSAPAGNDAARALADSTFAQVYGRIAISHPGQQRLLEGATPGADPATVLASARQQHASYVLFGAVDDAQEPRLTVKLLRAENGALAWSASYPTRNADPVAIAKEVDRRVSQEEDDN